MSATSNQRQEGPFHTPGLRAAVRLAVRASSRPRQRKSKRAVTRDVLDRLLATCRSDRLVDTRDLAVLLLAFASGGRRRSEVARLRVEQISDEPAVPLDPKDPQSSTLPCVAIQLGRTKTGVADEAGRVLLVGPPVEALREWLMFGNATRSYAEAFGYRLDEMAHEAKYQGKGKKDGRNGSAQSTLPGDQAEPASEVAAGGDRNR